MVREKRQRTADKEEPATSTGKAGAPTSLHEACCKVVRELRKHAHAAPFNQPVSPEEASDYAEVLAAASTQPMDLETIEARAAAGAYASIDEGGGDAAALRRDMAQIWRACEVYNGPNSPLYASVTKLSKAFDQLDKKFLTSWENGGSGPTPKKAAAAKATPQAKATGAGGAAASALKMKTPAKKKGDSSSSSSKGSSSSSGRGAAAAASSTNAAASATVSGSPSDLPPQKKLKIVFKTSGGGRTSTSPPPGTAPSHSSSSSASSSSKGAAGAPASSTRDKDPAPPRSAGRGSSSAAAAKAHLAALVSTGGLKCEHCFAPHDGTYGSGRFCNSACRSRFNGGENVGASGAAGGRVLENVLNAAAGDGSGGGISTGRRDGGPLVSEDGVVGPAGYALVRKRAARAAKQRFKQRGHPLPVASAGFRVVDWGSLQPDVPGALGVSLCTKDMLFPLGYKSLFWYKHTNVVGRPRGVVAEYLSSVRSHPTAPPVFAVVLASNGFVASSATAPAAAWKPIVRPAGGGKGGAGAGLLSPGVRLTERRLVRCQAVLNWLTHRPWAHYFWNPVDERAHPNYRAIVRKPTCLKFVQERLSSKFYVSEFEFMADLRLVFANYMVYHDESSSSELWNSAADGLRFGDALFCEWVLNACPTETLKGSSQPDKYPGAETDQVLDKANLFDKWQPMVLDRPLPPSSSRPPPPVKPSVSGKMAKGNLMGWEPAPGLPGGWFQAFKGGGSLTDSADQQQHQQQHQPHPQEHLEAAGGGGVDPTDIPPGQRIMLFSRDLLSPLGRRCLPNERPPPSSRGKKGGASANAKRQQAAEAAFSTQAEAVAALEALETRVETSNEALASDDGASIAGQKPTEAVPPDGFFGLGHPGVKTLLEGLPHAEAAAAAAEEAGDEPYEFEDAPTLCQELVAEAEKRKSEQEERGTIDEAVRRKLHLDRLHFPRKRRFSHRRGGLPPLPSDENDEENGEEESAAMEEEAEDESAQGKGAEDASAAAADGEDGEADKQEEEGAGGGAGDAAKAEESAAGDASSSSSSAQWVLEKWASGATYEPKAKKNEDNAADAKNSTATDGADGASVDASASKGGAAAPTAATRAGKDLTLTHERQFPEKLLLGPGLGLSQGPHQAEELLAVWDFLCAFHKVLGLLPLPFSDFFHAVTKTGSRRVPGSVGAAGTPSTATAAAANGTTAAAAAGDGTGSSSGAERPVPMFASLPALHLNEMGQGLTRALLMDMDTCLMLKTDRDKKDLFALKPCNALTWPEMARQCLVTMTQYRHCTSVTSADSIRWLRQYPRGTLAIAMDLLAVLTSHPLSGPFLEPVNAVEVSGYTSVVTKPMDLSAVRRKLYNYEHHKAFASDVRLVWTNCLAFNDPNSYLGRCALCLSQFFEELYEEWITKPEKVEAEEIAAAEAAAAEPAAGTDGVDSGSSVTAASAVDASAGDAEPKSDNSNSNNSSGGGGAGSFGASSALTATTSSMDLAAANDAKMASLLGPDATHLARQAAVARRLQTQASFAMPLALAATGSGAGDGQESEESAAAATVEACTNAALVHPAFWHGVPALSGGAARRARAALKAKAKATRAATKATAAVAASSSSTTAMEDGEEGQGQGEGAAAMEEDSNEGEEEGGYDDDDDEEEAEDWKPDAGDVKRAEKACLYALISPVWAGYAMPYDPLIEGPAIHTRRLASTLQLLRDVEPEEWTVNQRLIVLNLLVNELLDTAAARQALDMQALAAEEATSKDVLAAQAVNDGFLDPADMPEGSGPLPGEETICELASMDFETVSLRGPPALSNTRLRKGVPPPKRPLSTIATAAAAAAFAAALDEGDDEANRLPFESYLGLTLEEVEAAEKRVSSAHEAATATAAEATAATKAAADAVAAEATAKAEEAEKAAAAAAAAAATAAAASGAASDTASSAGAAAGGAVTAGTAPPTAPPAVAPVAAAAAGAAVPSAVPSSQVATLQAAAQAASVTAQRAQARLASLPPPVSPAEGPCSFCGLTQSFSTQPWVRVPDLLLKPISDEVFDEFALRSHQMAQWNAKHKTALEAAVAAEERSFKEAQLQKSAASAGAPVSASDGNVITISPAMKATMIARARAAALEVAGPPPSSAAGACNNPHRAHMKCAQALLRTREQAVRAEKQRQEWEIHHWNRHCPSPADHAVPRLRSETLGTDLNGTSYWMVGGATGQLLARLPSGHWGLYDIPYRVYQLWASLKDSDPEEWLLRRRILGELSSKNPESTDIIELGEKRRRLLHDEWAIQSALPANAVAPPPPKPPLALEAPPAPAATAASDTKITATAAAADASATSGATAAVATLPFTDATAAGAAPAAVAITPATATAEAAGAAPAPVASTAGTTATEPGALVATAGGEAGTETSTALVATTSTCDTLVAENEEKEKAAAAAAAASSAAAAAATAAAVSASCSALLSDEALLDEEELVQGRLLELRYADYLQSTIDVSRAAEDAIAKRESERRATPATQGAAIKAERRRRADELLHDLADFHPTKGWLRTDACALLVALRAETMATKLATRVVGCANMVRLHARPASQQALFGTYANPDGRPGAPSLALAEDGHGFLPSAAMGPGRGPPKGTKGLGRWPHGAKHNRGPRYNPTSSQSRGGGTSTVRAVSRRPLKKNVDKSGYKVTSTGGQDSRYKPVVQLDVESGTALHFWMSGSEAARHVRVAQSAISLCARGGRREAGGFSWRFANEGDLKQARELQEKAAQSAAAAAAAAAASQAESGEGGGESQLLPQKGPTSFSLTGGSSDTVAPTRATLKQDNNASSTSNETAMEEDGDLEAGADEDLEDDEDEGASDEQDGEEGEDGAEQDDEEGEDGDEQDGEEGEDGDDQMEDDDDDDNGEEEEEGRDGDEEEEGEESRDGSGDGSREGFSRSSPPPSTTTAPVPGNTSTATSVVGAVAKYQPPPGAPSAGGLVPVPTSSPSSSLAPETSPAAGAVRATAAVAANATDAVASSEATAGAGAATGVAPAAPTSSGGGAMSAATSASTTTGRGRGSTEPAPLEPWPEPPKGRVSSSIWAHKKQPAAAGTSTPSSDSSSASTTTAAGTASATTPAAALSPKFIKLKSELLNLAALLPYEPLPPSTSSSLSEQPPLSSPSSSGVDNSGVSGASVGGANLAAPTTSGVTSAMELDDTSSAAGSSTTNSATIGAHAATNPYSWSGQGIEVARYDHPAWAETVRAAEDPRALLDCIFALEIALPSSWLAHWYRSKAFPDGNTAQGPTVAAVASRVFALDRALKYSEPLDKRPPGLMRLRPYGPDAGWLTSFSNHCHASLHCSKPFNHGGKCQPSHCAFTRVVTLPDQKRGFVPLAHAPPNPPNSTAFSGSSGNNSASASSLAASKKNAPLSASALANFLRDRDGPAVAASAAAAALSSSGGMLATTFSQQQQQQQKEWREAARMQQLQRYQKQQQQQLPQQQLPQQQLPQQQQAPPHRHFGPTSAIGPGNGGMPPPSSSASATGSGFSIGGAFPVGTVGLLPTGGGAPAGANGGPPMTVAAMAAQQQMLQQQEPPQQQLSQQQQQQQAPP